MKTRTFVIFGAIVFALIVAFAFAKTSYAQGPNDRPGPGYGPGTGVMAGQRGGMGPQASLIALAADELGLTQQELIAQLQNNTTVAQIAEQQGVELSAIVEAFVAPRAERMQAAVAAERMTQAQADQQLATMQAQVTARLSQPWTPQGYGPGTGYVDADGDGVCDHQGTGAGAGPRRGQGRMGQ